jgi:ABC-type Fe3+-hydroxamate transport system substrate-binding protein
MPIITDQTGYKLFLEKAPKRIISIVPSQSEFLWDIGLEKELVGITKFCIHPEKMFRSVERVGGTKKLDLEKIRKLKPDLIIGNKEENERSDIEALRKEFAVWMSDIYDLSDAFDMMSSLGLITNREKEAEKIIKAIKVSFGKLDLDKFKGKKAAYFIWYKPYMVAAKNTFIDHLLMKLGFINVFAYLERYPEINPAQISQASPELILLSSEPFPFGEKHVRELEEICPNARIVLVDGEVFSWYGSRLLHSVSYFNAMKTD